MSPRTKHCRIVACIFHILRQEGFIDRHAPRRVKEDDVGLGAETNGVAPGHKGRACRTTDRLDVLVMARGGDGGWVGDIQHRMVQDNGMVVAINVCNQQCRTESM